jgi:biopolymer transport protein ExbD
MQGPSNESSDSVLGEINVIPFIDVCLVLLIIVLMTAAATTNFVKVLLPTAKKMEYVDINLATTLSVNKKGEFFFEEETNSIAPQMLWMRLMRIQGDNPWDTVMIRCDKETPGECLVQLIQCAQSLGVAHIGLGVQSKEQAAAAANAP